MLNSGRRGGGRPNAQNASKYRRGSVLRKTGTGLLLEATNTRGPAKGILPRFFFLGPGIIILCYFVGSMLSPRSQFCGPAFTHGNRHGKQVSLTFDDGPNEPYTGQILDILQARGVKATFFLIGQNAEHFPDSVRREVAMGMEIGNHSFSHANVIQEDSKSLLWQITKTQETLSRISGVEPKWFRPPHGFRDFRLFPVTRRCELSVAEWNNMPRDWTCPGTEVIVKRVLQKLKPGDIVLLHDGASVQVGGDRSQTVRALPAILDGIAARGLQPVTLTELARGGGRGLKDYRRFEGKNPSAD